MVGFNNVFMKSKIRHLIIVCGLWFVVSCGGNESAEPANDETIDPIEAGKAIYISNCKLCHGDDGTLGSSGSANLKISVLQTQDLTNVITYGKGNMAGFKGLIEPDDIKNVVAYIETLRQK